MANKIINGTSGSLTGYTATLTIDAAADYLLIQQGGAGVYKSINRNSLLGITGAPLGTTDTQNVTNKTLDNTNTITLKDTLFTLQDDGDTSKQAKFQLSGITTATTRTYTLPNASSTLADIATAQTFTNKTLTSPVITGGSIDNTTITVDSISGHTTPTLVTVGGVQMNNGVIGTANAVTTTALADSAVTPAKLLTGTGSGWALQSYTPTWTALTIGNGTNSSSYVQIGKIVFGTVSLTLGSTSAVSGSILFTLPVTSKTGAYYSDSVTQIGSGGILIAGVSSRAMVLWNTSTTAKLRYYNPAAAGPGIDADTSSTSPGTWANGSLISVNFWYEVA